MLRNLEADFVTVGTAVRWEVTRVRMRSPLTMTVAPRISAKGGRATARKIIRACDQGIERIQNTASVPAHFNEEALNAARQLVSTIRKEGSVLTLGSDKKNRVTLTEQAVQHIDAIVSKARLYVDFSTIEGSSTQFPFTTTRVSSSGKRLPITRSNAPSLPSRSSAGKNCSASVWR